MFAFRLLSHDDQHCVHTKKKTQKQFMVLIQRKDRLLQRMRAAFELTAVMGGGGDNDYASPLLCSNLMLLADC